MNSPTKVVLEMPPEQELLRFDHPTQWRGRPGWHERLSLSEHNLARIVGGYQLARDLFQHCGLCNTSHGRGYVVATTDGLETQIGKDCGLKHLGARFEELERQFTASMDRQDRLTSLRELLARKGELLQMAQKAIADCNRAALTVVDIQLRIAREPTLDKVYQDALRAEGSVYIESRVSEDEYQTTKQRYRRELVARIDGHTATTQRPPSYAIKEALLPLIHSLSEDSLRELNGKRLMAKSKEADLATSLLTQATAYVELVRRFTSRRNWEAFATAFGPSRAKTNDRGRRTLQQIMDIAVGLGSANDDPSAPRSAKINVPEL